MDFMKYSGIIKEYIASHKEELISLVGELISIKSVKSEPCADAPFGRENAEVLGFMLRKCEEYGFITDNADNYAGSADINTLEPALAILSHLDVVPEGEGWSSDPYVMRRDEAEGRLYGRGATDDKGPAAASLFAARAVKELGIPLKRGVRLIFGTDEENGSSDLEYYCQKRSLPEMVFTPDGSYPVINIEKGMIRMNISAAFEECGAIRFIRGGSVINAVPGTAEAELDGIMAEDAEKLTAEFEGVEFSFAQKGTQLHIWAKGVSGHASQPEKGRNAVTALIGLISRLPLDKDNAQTKAVKALAQLYPYGETDGSSCGIACSDEKSGGLTLVLSVIDLNESGFEAKNDIRFPISRTSSELIGAIAAKAGSLGLDAETIMFSEPHYTDENSPFIQTLLRVYEECTGDEGRCIAIGGGTYVHHIEGGVAFGAEFPGEDVNMHGADEFISIENLLKDAEIMANAIAELCGE